MVIMKGKPNLMILIGAIAATVITLTAGCTGQQNTGATSTTAATISSSATDTSTSTSAAAAPDTTTPGGQERTPECKAANLKLGLSNLVGGALGHITQVLRFTNVSRTTCVMVGFPGVSYVTGPNGRQIGDPAVREGARGRQVTLAPGQLASALITIANPDHFDANTCKPTQIRGFRVYAPDDTTAMYVARPNTTVCASNPGEPTLEVQSVNAGAGNP